MSAAQERAQVFAACEAKLNDPKTSPEEKREIEELLQAYATVVELNPLEEFEPHSPPQQQFLEASTPLVAAFAGNRFGKTTIEVVRALVDLCDRDSVPEHLRGYKRFDAPCYGRIVVPDLTATLIGVLLPAFRRWTPKQQLLGGTFDKAWDKQNRILRFQNGSWVQAMTYEMDLDKFGGSALHFVAYDEPPPEDIRNECRMRLIDHGGYEMFAMTPLMGIGWVYRHIWKQREHPDVTVIRGSIHDNPTLDESSKNRIIGAFDKDDPERRAREFGEFAHFGGMVYPGGFESVLIDPPSPKQVQALDVVVGIDPGLKNAAFTWLGFDDDNRCFVFDEVLLQEKQPQDYVEAVRRTNEKWGLTDPLYVIDPSARNRSLTNAESVEAELQRLGIYPMHGQNAVEAGVQNIRRRMAAGAFFVSRDCRGLRGEAEEYRAENRPDGEFKVVKENDHRLDALRYAVMSRAWDPVAEQERPNQMLGWELGKVPAPKDLSQYATTPAPPMGAMS